MSKKSCRKETSLTKFLKAPIRALTRAKDGYVKGMTSYTGSISISSGAGAGIGGVSHGTMGDDDFRELVRAASVRTMMMAGLEEEQQEPLDLRRNQSVGMARIDEEKACEFGPDDGLLFMRSRTVANHRYI